MEIKCAHPNYMVCNGKRICVVCGKELSRQEAWKVIRSWRSENGRRK